MLVSSLFMLTFLVATSAAHAEFSPERAENLVSAVVRSRNNAGAARLINQAAKTRDPNLIKAILAHSVETETHSPFKAIMSTRAGCHYSPVTDRHTVKLLGITAAWQEVIEWGFCWNGKKITWLGKMSVKKYSSAPYCWTNTSSGENWDPAPKWVKVWSHGTIGGNFVWGCIPLQSDEVYFYIANGGGTFLH